VLLSVLHKTPSCCRPLKQWHLPSPVRILAPSPAERARDGVIGNRLGVGKAPSGYTVHKTEVWVSGDHVCGASAECREIARDDRQVLWEFRLQGHDPTGTARKTYVRGAYSSVLQRSIKCIAISAQLPYLLSCRSALKRGLRMRENREQKAQRNARERLHVHGCVLRTCPRRKVLSSR